MPEHTYGTIVCSTNIQTSIER